MHNWRRERAMAHWKIPKLTSFLLIQRMQRADEVGEVQNVACNGQRAEHRSSRRESPQLTSCGEVRSLHNRCAAAADIRHAVFNRRGENPRASIMRGLPALLAGGEIEAIDIAVAPAGQHSPAANGRRHIYGGRVVVFELECTRGSVRRKFPAQNTLVL